MARARAKKRYEKLEDILNLALQMQTSYTGVSLKDIEDRFGVQRRTAERMRDAVLRVWPGASSGREGDGKKYWRIEPKALLSLPPLSLEELTHLDTGAKFLRQGGHKGGADALLTLSEKLRAWLEPGKRRKFSVDLEALTEAEGIASRPSPRQKIDETLLSPLRSAILARKKIRIAYFARSRGGSGTQIVHPYGFVYGVRHYLLAWSEKYKDFRYFTLSNITKVAYLDDTFDARPDFLIKKYTSRSFGVYQEDKTWNVVWRFSKKMAKDALEFNFHPSQTVKKEKDGSVLVTFKACGLLEMCWHLFTWGPEVEILEPKELKEMFKEILSAFKKV